MVCSGDIEFVNIEFSYPTRSDMIVLKNFNFKVKPNQTVALVGASGSGFDLFVLSQLNLL
jgi:ATP-binding cassette subfamily B (MDR/TAP) protein 1